MSRVEHLAEGVTLHLGDCREILPTLGKVDAVVTDPPYGLGKVLQAGKAVITNDRKWPLMKGDAMLWDAQIASNLVECVASANAAIVWGGNYYDLPPRRGWLIWDKIVRNFSTGHVEMAWTTLDQPTRAFNYAHGELATEGKFHPTQKPLPLMKWCLGFLPPELIIFDPFMGSGTTGVAAVNLDRRFIGIEIEPAYFDIACRRISDELARPRLQLEPIAKPTQGALL